MAMANQGEMEVLENLELLVENQCNINVDSESLKYHINTIDKFLNIVHLNIRSIRKNFDELLIFLQVYNLTDCQIIILSECWKIPSCDQYNIPGFITYYNEGDYNKNDGVLVLVKSEIVANFDIIKFVKSSLNAVRLTFKINDVTLGITAVYRPPPSSMQYFLGDIERYYADNLHNQIEIFVGDININISDKENNFVNLYLATLSHYGFISCINSPTRVTIESASCLDHIFVKMSNYNKFKYKSFILNSDITDHYPVMLNLTCKGISEVNKMNANKTLIIKKIDHKKLQGLIKEQNWNNVMTLNDPNMAADTFSSTFLTLIEQSKITKKIHIKNVNKQKPWITIGIINSIKKRDKMKRQLLKNHNIIYRNEYKIYRNNLNKVIAHAKNNYYKSKVENNKNNIKKIYKIISEATNESTGTSHNNIQILDENSQPFANDKEMADYCNVYFANVGLEMADKIVPPVIESEVGYDNISSMFLKPVTQGEIIKHIHSLKNNSSPGIDGISAEVIKDSHLYILNPLAHIINLIFKTGIVPSCFKNTIITPIHKAGSKMSINNYRPINLVNNFAKIFEKCLKDRLISYLNANQILSKNQYGFLSGSSTCDAIYHLTKEITENLNDNNKCIAVFLDLAKAFDTVPHIKLLDVLHRYGVRGTVLNVFKNYLSDRYQMVRIRETISSPSRIEMGVPQGTVLGPILFIIYLNSLTNLDINGTIISFADDTVLLFHGVSWNQTKSLAIDGVNKVHNWLSTFKLSLNVKKTHYIAFSLTSANRPDFTSIRFNNTSDELKETTQTKYLGIIIDQNLKWDKHILKLTSNLRKLIHKFYLMREFLGKKILNMVYKALVESLIRYGIIAWGGLYNNSLKQLNVIQNFILKVINKKTSRYPTHLLYSHDILNVRSLFILSSCSYIHKNNSLKKFITHQHGTRGNIRRNLQIPIVNKNISLRSFLYLAPKFYNLLPAEIKQLNNLKNFNKNCRFFINSHYNSFKNFF